MNKPTGIHLPLTQSQVLLWTGQKLNPAVPLYNVPYAYEISGVISKSVFSKAFQELINGVDVMRTIYFEENGLPYQSVLPRLDHTIEIVDFTATGNTKEIKDWIGQRSQKLFDMSKPLFDAALLKVKDERYIWFLNVHHLIIDAISSTILFDRMSEIYGLILSGDTGRLTELPQYAAYVSFETEQRKSDAYKKNRSYWQGKVKNLIEPLLYGQKKSTLTTQSGRVRLKLGLERSEKLKELARRPEIRAWTQDLSLYNIFATLLFVFLYRISGQKRLSVGAPFHNRTSSFKETVGLFIELFPIVAELEEEDTFLSVLQRIRLESNDYLRYAQPGMATFELSRGFSSILNFINASYADFCQFPTKSEWIHPNHSDPAHQIRCNVVDFDGTGEMEILFDLNHSTFDQDLQQKVPDHFLNLLDAMLGDIDMRIQQPELVTVNEKNFFLEIPLETDTYISIFEYYEKSVEDHPSSIALRFGDTTLRYEVLDKKVHQLASLLKNKGVKFQDRIGLYFFRGPEYITSLLAVLKLGATFVPMASDQPIERIGYILNNSECTLVLTETKLLENVKAHNVPVLIVDMNSIQQSVVAEVDLERIPDRGAIAYILYTSGSTGNPKGVMISHGALANYLLWAKEYYRIDKAFNFPLFTSIGFDLTITSTFLPLLSGGELVIYSENDTGPDVSLMQVIEENKVNSIKLTPSHIALIRDKNLSSSKIRRMIVGGEDLKTNTAKAIQKSLGESIQIYNEYGPTEATVGCIVSEFNPAHHTDVSVPIGKPISNMKAYVLDAYKNIVPLGVVGELYVSGCGLALGYANMEELSKEKFVENPFAQAGKMYRTGDLVRYNNAGDLEFLGRKDEQIKLNGFRIELSDIEANVTDHPGIENAAVVVINDKETTSEEEREMQQIVPENNHEKLNNTQEVRQTLVAYYTGSSKIPSTELNRYLSKKLPAYMIPRMFTYMEELPLTSNGKVDKAALRSLNYTQTEIDTSFVAPRNEIEELLDGIWKEVLQLNKIGVHDNFIALGGHSLAAIRVTARINDELEMNFSLSKIFDLPTIAEYAQFIEKTILELLE